MEVSKSKAKRLERQKEVAAKKRKNITHKVIWTVAIVAILALVVFLIGNDIYKKSKITKSIEDYSKGLTESGMIDGINPSDYLTLCDIDNLVVPLSEVEATAEEIQSDIDSVLSSNTYVDTDPSLEVKDGDTVNIDYVGTIDGVAFDGGTAEGSNLVIGSGSFIDTFEVQLIGSHPGDDVTVNVTFPEDYGNTDLAGKPAEFAVKVNGLEATPEFDDTFVAEHLSDYALTADEYRAYVANNYYENHLVEYLSNYIIENSTVASYPKNYVKTLKGITKFNDEFNLSYYNNMFSSYGLTTYDTIWAMRNLESEEAYEEELTTRAEETCKQALCYQALSSHFNLSVDFDSYKAEVDAENGEGTIDSMIETYGKGYLMQAHINETVMNHLKETVKVQ